MRFFTKLFLCVLAVLTAALAFAEYFTVTGAFQTAVSQQTEEALQQHQLVKYAIQSDLLSAQRTGAVDSATIQEVGEQAGQALAVNLTLQTVRDTDADTTHLQYAIQEGAGTQSLVVTSQFVQSGYTLSLTTEEDISALYQQSWQLQSRCQVVFLAAEGVCAGITLLLSWLLTRPIQALERATRAYTRGNLKRRLPPRSHDEIGDLTRSYNIMADTIQEKLEALELSVRQREDFVASFAHEIKTPMTSIIGYADTLYQNQLPPDQVQEAAGYILNEGLRLEALSFKLMELITLEKQQFLLEEMEAEPLLQDAEQTARANADKRGVALSVECRPGRIRVEYDLFKTLLLNLTDNALKSGGSQVTLSAYPQGETYRILVEDNGRGIPEDQLSRITEAFYMVDKSRSRKEHGAGLGLALCRRIANIHHAKMEFDSVEGVGTTVELILPLCPPLDQEVEE